MAVIAPFRGILYNPGKVGDMSKVVAPPYDVISPEGKNNRARIIGDGFTFQWGWQGSGLKIELLKMRTIHDKGKRSFRQTLAVSTLCPFCGVEATGWVWKKIRGLNTTS